MPGFFRVLLALVPRLFDLPINPNRLCAWVKLGLCVVALAPLICLTRPRRHLLSHSSKRRGSVSARLHPNERNAFRSLCQRWIGHFAHAALTAQSGAGSDPFNKSNLSTRRILRAHPESFPARPVHHIASTLLHLACWALLLCWTLSPLAVGAQTPQQSHAAQPPAMSPWVQQHYRSEVDAATVVRRLNAAAAATTSTPLQFKGVVTTFEPTSTGLGQGLLRQNGCSLSLLSAAGEQATTLAGSTPNYQNTLHTLAQLTTTPNVFKNGCTDPLLGRMGHFATIVGTTSQGYYVGAIGQLNGSETAVNTYVWDAVNEKLISMASNSAGSSSNLGPISVADVNGDGINDMVVPDFVAGTSPASSVAVFLGNADGTFQAAVLYPVPLQGSAIVLDDFNGDGTVDIAVSGNTTGVNQAVAVLPGKGNGTFGTAVVSSAGTGSAFGLVSADFNGDGHKDIALFSGAILLGKGDGTFTVAPQAWSTNVPSGSAFGMVASDFNNDGKVDLAVVSFDPAFNAGILLGNGDGTFSFKASYALISESDEITSSDLDGDGNLDLVVGSNGDGGFASGENTKGSFQVLMGNGDGSFQGATVFPGFAAPQISGVHGFAVADFNADGHLDMAGKGQTAAGAAALSVMTGDGKGDFAQGPVTAMRAAGETDLVPADMNGDGKADALTLLEASFTGTAGALNVYLGEGNGSFQAGVSYPLPAAPVNYAVADVNGDGKPDVIVLADSSAASNGFSGTGTPGIYELLNNGDGTLAMPQLIDGAAVDGSIVVIADVNGDGKPDLVVQQNGYNINFISPTPGNVLVYLGQGNGTFAAAVPYLPNTFGGSALAVVDVNGDGKPDIVTTTESYTNNTYGNSLLTVLPGNGDGSFGTAITTAQADDLPFLTDIAVADFNGDGKLDVAQGECCGDSETWMFFGNGDGTFQTPIPLGLAGSSTSLTAAEVSGGKYSDLLLSSGGQEGAADVVLLANLYGANLTPSLAATTTTAGASPNPAAVGQTVTLTAMVAGSSGSGAPTGTVTFYDGTTSLGTGTLSPSGVATYATTALPVGSDSITAVYGGSTSFSGSTSAAVTVTVTAVVVNPSFALSSSGNITVSPGAMTGNTSTISATGSNGFSGAVSLSCAVSPMAASGPATCSLSPTSVTLSGATAQTSTLTITTTAATSAALSLPGHPKSGGVPVPWYAAGGTLACLLLFGIPARRRGWRAMLGMLILLAFLTGGLSSCSGGGSTGGSGGSSGGSGSGNSGTTAGMYTVTVTGTSGSTMETTAVTLTVN